MSLIILPEGAEWKLLVLLCRSKYQGLGRGQHPSVKVLVWRPNVGESGS